MWCARAQQARVPVGGAFCLLYCPGLPPLPHLLCPLPSPRQVFITTIYYKRWKWSPLKSRRIIVDVVN